MVSHTHIQPREEQANRDCPSVQEHAGQKVGVLVSFDDQKVGFDVARCQDEVLPAVFEHHLSPSFPSIWGDGSMRDGYTKGGVDSHW